MSDDVRHFSKNGTAPTACSCPLSLIFCGDKEVGCSLAILPRRPYAANAPLFPRIAAKRCLVDFLHTIAVCALSSAGDETAVCSHNCPSTT